MSAMPNALPAFSGYGIELEYMIVNRQTLDVMPIADQVLRLGAGRPASEVRRGPMGWSNEFVLHVIEVKNLAPMTALNALPDLFLRETAHINQLLQAFDACLMPGAMHPWMDPRSETRLWPHENDAIYNAYARIFDTSTHGWANLQSMHINLPFADDDEFARLHAAVRLALPLLPALAASSPVADGNVSGCLDYRMQVYCRNADELPSIAGKVVPETVSSEADYQRLILAPMYRDIAPHDPDGVLQEEWLNSRGAIARFDRNAIEIRVIDTQECPRADLAVAAAAVHLVRRLYDAGADRLAELQAIPTDELAALLQACIRDADQTVIRHKPYLALMGVDEAECSAGALWRHVLADVLDPQRVPRPGSGTAWAAPLAHILEHGPLARRLMLAIGTDASRAHLAGVYRELCACLAEDRLFFPPQS
ncbi:Gamma-glutamyl:cysteine ligase YbdK, ATP-grasp superfamily [Noviherbaspirillum humi]|uniref:Gamma-glutamyl:cysteine ligase YbdK, ATP-grasp superfamily n=1 Tax=Noviherbaspirillum humi TaxID=1688639 RepID=A0A239DSW9_9BURK|nr:glutamate-cysteine ligase family protein [Noviherbaspirillum humi]SNS35299.1 Gamma-glutamyl:cysteine ligase YbdK, ATP-grasp superfamily [Noviherbaspirillum humi]